LLLIVLDSGVARESSGGTRSGTQALGARQHTFYNNLKRVLSRNLDQNMLKNAYFFENVKIAAASLPFASDGWGFRPQTPTLLLSPTITTLSKLVFSAKCALLPS